MYLATDYLLSPQGLMQIQASEKGVRTIRFVDTTSSPVCPNPHTMVCVRQLEHYFVSPGQAFSVALDLAGTDFQLAVWQHLQTIPCGETMSYQQIARALGRPKSARAVGAANGRNPVAVIVPCHRVLGSNGSLTGYAGGLTRKAWLLAHEQAELRLPQQSGQSQKTF